MIPLFNFLALGTAALTGVLYWYGLKDSYLLLYQWYDIPLHLLGGVTFGLWGSALAFPRSLTPKRALLLMLALALCAGVMWEIFEYAAGFARTTGYWTDTLKDLADDLLGAGAVGLVYWRMYKPKNEHEYHAS